MKRTAFGLMALTAVLFSASGCGYTTKTSLPENVQTVHVLPVENKIDISAEISNKKAFQVYRPGLEVELRNALIDRIVFDGHLRVAGEAASDAVMSVQLTGFDREPLRYNSNDTIQEFRVRVIADARLTDKQTGAVIWAEKSAQGEAEYFLSGPNATSEDEAVSEALKDLVRRLVEHLLEVW